MLDNIRFMPEFEKAFRGEIYHQPGVGNVFDCWRCRKQTVYGAVWVTMIETGVHKKLCRECHEIVTAVYAVEMVAEDLREKNG